MPILLSILFILPVKIAFTRVDVLYLAIIFFTLITLVMIISMPLILLSKKKALAKRKAFASQLEGWVMNVILENNKEVNPVFHLPDDVALLLQNKFARRVLLRELMKVKKSLSGKSSDNLENIYKQLKLYEISLQRVSSRLWHVKAKGIQELANMNQHSDYKRIFELTNHEDNLVRMEAQTATVRLNGYEGLQFFDNLSYPLSEWHQLNLLHFLSHRPILETTLISAWLNSSNISVVQFAIKLIAAQHAIEFQEEVIKCLRHPDKIVRLEAVLCLAQMPSNEITNELSTHFINEHDKNIRIRIIESFIKNGTEQDLPFLLAIRDDEDVDIKLSVNKTVLYLQKKINSR